MTLPRTLLTTSFLALLTASATANPLATPQRPYSPALLVTVSDGDVTGSLGDIRGLPSGELAALKGAVDAYQKGRVGDGDASASRLADPAARVLAEWIAIRSAPRDVGFDRIHAFLKAYPNWPAAQTVRRRAEEALLLDRAGARTVNAFFSDQKPLTDEGKIALARARLEAGDRDAARKLVRDAYRNDELSNGLEEIVVEGFGSLLGRADHKFRADRLIYDEKFKAGSRAAARAGKDVAALARARVAIANKAANGASLLKAVPASMHDDAAYLFARVELARRAERTRDAAALLAQAPDDAGALVSPDAWWTERRMVARQLLDGGDAKAAYRVAAGHSNESEQSRMEAEFHAGWIALRFLGDAGTAAAHFDRLTKIAERPISEARGQYWRGRAAEAGGGGNATAFYRAAAKHSTTYYGQLARARLGIDEVGLRSPGAPSAGDRSQFGQFTAVRAIEMLYDIGERDLARALVSETARRLDDAQLLHMLGSLAKKHGDARAALIAGKSAVQRGLPCDAIAYPTMGIPKFEAAGDVEKAVVYAIARQESEFNATAVSSADARGLMQVLPSTAKQTARALGMPFDARRLTSDPAYNARIGSAYLDQLIDRYDGSYILAFAAYNAGGSRVADWIKTYGDPRDPRVDPIDWVERIPFTETRNYVQRVMENVQVYRARLGRTALKIEHDMRRGG